MNASPYFSVILSTYARGEHIIPTIESVLRQSCADFELFVVGDGCQDETAEIVARYKSRGVRWHNLDANTGSQSAPNNFGIAHATGDWIAYVGHDDIWAPDHLESLRDLIIAAGDLDFAVGGCLYHGPEDAELDCVTGMFDWESAPFDHFFPPTSLAHRRDVVDRIGGWRDPREVVAPVDSDFLLRAAHAGLRFKSTMRVTAHKFAAGHRYLCTLRPRSDEQWAALDETKTRSEWLGAKLRKCRERGQVMAMRYPDFSRFKSGELFNNNRSNKGFNRPELAQLHGRVIIEQTGEPRALDWYKLERRGRPYRWSGPNPKPRILIPYTSSGEVQITLCLPIVGKVTTLSIAVNDRPVEHEIRKRGRGMAVVFRAPLDRSDYSIVTVHTPHMFCPDELSGNGDRRRVGIAVGDIIIEPLDRRRHFAGALWRRLLTRRSRLARVGG